MEQTETSSHSNPRMAAYRARMRAKGLRQVQLWVIDTKAPGFQKELNRQVRAVNRSDARDGIYEWMEAVQDTDGWH